MIEIVDTELVCNYNAYDKLHSDFILDYIQEFEKDNELNLLCSPLLVSKNIKDTFNTNLPLMYNKKKIFHDEKDIIINDTESNNMDYEYKLNLLKKCLSDNNYKTKSCLVKYNNVSIFDFFRIYGNNYIDINNYNLFTFCGCAPVWKKKLFDKYGGVMKIIMVQQQI